MTMIALSLLALGALELPPESDYEPIATPHFPSRLHAFVWRNYPLVTTERMAEVLGCSRPEVDGIARSMGCRPTASDQRKPMAASYITGSANWETFPSSS